MYSISVATALRRTSTPILLSASVVVTTATLVFLNTHVVEKCSHLINHLNMHASYGVSTIQCAVYFAARGLGQYSPLPKKAPYYVLLVNSMEIGSSILI